MASNFIITNWYWQVQSLIATPIWSSGVLGYLLANNATYQAWLQQGNFPTVLATVPDLQQVMVSQYVPAFTQPGLTIISLSNTALNSTYGLDDITVTAVGTLARDSACGLGLPLEAGFATFSDIFGNTQTFNAAQIQSLYQAMRDYITNVTVAVTNLVNSQAGSLPTQPVTIA